jgi:hypothetical protein
MARSALQSSAAATSSSERPPSVGRRNFLTAAATPPHKDPVVKRWLGRHPRFELHFTANGSSWMNLVERFFRDLS